MFVPLISPSILLDYLSLRWRKIINPAMAAVDSFDHLLREISLQTGNIRDVLALVGLYYVTKNTVQFSYEVITGVRTHLWSKVRPIDLNNLGEWAVVTGGSDGIGKAFAIQLAKKGLNVVIIARDQEKLTACAQEIVAITDVIVETISIDFSSYPQEPIYETIAQKLHSKDIAVLVNNVGVMFCRPSAFLEVSTEELWGLLSVNMAPVLFMTRMVLPQMVQKERGAILNVSSITALRPLPLMGAYSASKVFIDSFTQSLDRKYRSKGIIVQSLLPSYVVTRLTGFSTFLRSANFIVPDPEAYASNAVRTIGYSHRTTGFWSHGILYSLFSIVPDFLWYPCSSKILRLLDNRSRVD